MKIQLDTSNKTIKLEENVKLSVFINLLKKLLPNNEWKEFTLETNTIIQQWTSPVIIDRWYERPYRYQPWYGIISSSAGDRMTADYKVQRDGLLKGGTYNIEVSNKLL